MLTEGIEDVDFITLFAGVVCKGENRRGACDQFGAVGSGREDLQGFGDLEALGQVDCIAADGIGHRDAYYCGTPDGLVRVADQLIVFKSGQDNIFTVGNVFDCECAAADVTGMQSRRDNSPSGIFDKGRVDCQDYAGGKPAWRVDNLYSSVDGTKWIR